MKKLLRYTMPLMLLTLIGVYFVGCGLIEPEDTEMIPNSPPETEIVAAPSQGDDHSYFMTISWIGNDADGYVVRYLVSVDGGAEFETTQTDSTFKFTAANKDESHSIRVAAIDDDGAVDPSPAERSFTGTNVAPETAIELDDDPAEGSTFGRAQKFYIIPTDPDNGPEFSYRYKIDEDGQWSAWLDDPVVEFYEGSPFGLLDEGNHTFYAQTRDAAMAVDETPATYSFVVSLDVQPIAMLTTSFNNHAFYEDNSAFYFESDSNNVRLSWEVDASAYFGHYSAVKFKLDDNPETNWLSITDTLFAELSNGEHTFTMRVKDTGGIESEEVVFNFNLVKPTFNAGILVVDDVNGRFAQDVKADSFYMDVLTAVGATYRLWDYRTEGAPTPGNGLGNYSTVIWEADESFMVNLPQQILLMKEYMLLGGNVWISGWKPVQQLATVTPVANLDPTTVLDLVDNYEFLWEFFKLATTKQSPGNPPDFTGATGLGGHPNINVDAAKNFIPQFANKLTSIDMFTIRQVDGAEAIYTFNSASENPDFQDEATGAKYIGDDFKTVIFGFPFYFINNDEAISAATKILQDFGEI